MMWLLHLIRLSLVGASVLLAITYSLPASAEFSCPNGAVVDGKKRCKFFAAYKDDDSPSIDPRVMAGLKVTSGQLVRTIGIIVGISNYPYMKDVDVRGAAHDVQNLKNFLIENQGFDEVIVLENRDATRSNIDYFLRIYASKKGEQYGGRARLVFAYSGHGTQIANSTTTALVLSAAKTSADINNLIELSELGEAFRSVAKHYYHVLALINACYGGSLFKWGQNAANPWVRDESGAYAVTAGLDDDLVYSLGGPNDGSIFFDSLIAGVKSGAADDGFPALTDYSGNAQRGGVVSLGSLVRYMSLRVAELNRSPIGTRRQKQFAVPYYGSIGEHVARGAFFFLSPIRNDTGQPARQTVRLAIPPGPVSSMQGNPELKVFNSPEEYSVRGVDVSSRNGPIDWSAVGTQVSFAYISANKGPGPDARSDESFLANWAGARIARIRRGAYYTFSFCVPAKAQFKNLAEIIPDEEDALPVAIAIDNTVVACDRAPIEVLRAELHKLTEMVKAKYRKIPIIYGNADAILELVDASFDEFSLWVAYHRTKPLRLSGRNPWSLWQYTVSGRLAGIEGMVDQNVFFGTNEQFDLFASGRSNTALAATIAFTEDPRPLVLLMDSHIAENVYCPRTRKNAGSNYDDITKLLKDLPIRIAYEPTNLAWQNQQHVLDERPSLVIIHASAFQEKTASMEGNTKLINFLNSLKGTGIHVLVYTRGLSQDSPSDVQKRWEVLMHALHDPDLKKNAKYFLMPQRQQACFEDPKDGEPFREKIKAMLESLVVPP
jgi:lysozyme